MESRTYRPFPGYALSALVVASMMLWALGVGLRDPDVVTPKGLLIFSLFGIVEASVICGGIRFVRASWRFTITPDSLIAQRKLSGDRVEIPWPSIIEVVKVRRAWWNRRGKARQSKCGSCPPDCRKKPKVCHRATNPGRSSRGW